MEVIFSRGNSVFRTLATLFVVLSWVCVDLAFATDDGYLTSGGEHSCGLKNDGTIVCWGEDRSIWWAESQLAIPPSGTFVQLSSKVSNNCALRTDGSAVCWSFMDYYGETYALSGTFKRIVAGGTFSCGIRDNGNVECWGSNWFGQLNAPLGSFKQIDAWMVHACGVRENGLAVCWGSNRYGESIAPSEQFEQVSLGYDYTCGLRTDKSIVCWGSNADGQLSAPSGTFNQISAGSVHICGLTESGAVLCGGNNIIWQIPPPDGAFVSVSSGRWHMCAEKTDGTVICWGQNEFMQATPPAWLVLKIPTSNTGTQSLTFTSSIPENSSAPLSVTSRLTFAFSSPIDPSKIGANLVIEGGQSSVAYSTSLSADGKTLAVVPSLGVWNSGTPYAVKFLSGFAGTDGKTLGADKVFAFTTESAPWTPDSAPALVSSIFPQCSSYGYFAADPVCGALNFSIAEDNGSVTYASSADVQAAGDPVSLSTGEFSYRDAFLRLSGELPYEFSLSYRSQTYANGETGMGWSHNYAVSLQKNPDGSVTYSDGELGAYTFVSTGSGAFGKVPGIQAGLSESADGTFVMEFQNGKRYSFYADGKISEISDRNGNTLSFSYGSDGKLTSVTDARGRKTEYARRADGRIVSVSAEGRTAELSYYSGTEPGGGAHDLKSVTVRQGGLEKTVSFEYASVPNDPVLSHNLTKLVDAKGQTYVENAYDGHDRVVSQKYGSGTLRYAYETGTLGQTVKNAATDRNGNVTEYVFDTRGNVTEKTHRIAGTDSAYRYSYDPDGRVVSEIRPDGSGTRYRYGADGNLTEERRKADASLPDDDSADIVNKRAYDPVTGLLSELTDPEGSVTRVSYDALGNLTSVETPAFGGAAVTRFERDGAGRVVKITDPEGRITAYVHSADGLPVSVTRGEGAEAVTETLSYDAFGNPATVTDAEGNVREFEYDAFGKLLSDLSPEGVLKKYAHDANGNRTRTEILVGSGKILAVDSAFGLLDEILSANVGTSAENSRAVSKTYDANGNVAGTVYPDGSKTEYSYDALGKVTEKRAVSSDGSVSSATRYSYDANGNLTKITDPLGNVTGFGYDAFGRVSSATDAEGNVTRYAYDKLGRVLAYRAFDKDGREALTKIFGYDAAGNRTSESATDPATGKVRATSATYDKAGKILSSTNAAGNATRYSYDSLGRLAKTADPLGNVTKLSYDRRGLVTERRVTGTDGTSAYVRSTYDKDGRKTSETDSLGQITRFEYDSLGRVTRKTDPAGTVTEYGYDAFGGLLSETVSGSGVTAATKWTYDTMGRKTSLTDANGNVTHYAYDPLGRLASETDAAGVSTRYSYDAAGNLLSKTDGNGTVVSYAYDPLGRLISRSEIPGAGVVPTPKETYSYDSLGRLVSAKEEGGGALAFSYDAFGNLLSESSDGKTVAYARDSLGNVTELSYPSGRKVSRTYDARSRISGIASVGAKIADYSYGSLTLRSLALGNGAKTEYAYDALLRMESLVQTVPGKNAGPKNPSAPETANAFTFAYSPAGDPLSDGRDSFRYDALSRLVSAGYAPFAGKTKLTEAFSYDPAGNRETFTAVETKDAGKKSKTETETFSYSSDALNQYSSLSATGDGRDRDADRKGHNGKNVRSFSYDRNGNLLSDGTFRYAYDSRNRLREVRKDGKGTETVAKYSYDPLGRRTAKEAANLRTEYAYAGHDAVEEEDFEKGDGKWEFSETRENVFGNGTDDLVTVFRTKYEDGKPGKTETLYFLKDRIGSTSAVTDGKGKILREYRYSAFGAPYVREGKSENWKGLRNGSVVDGHGDGNGSLLTLRLFTGREYDQETGLYYYRARTYSPELGRFLQRDPVWTADQVNLYAYVGNGPLKWTDPMGREKATLTNIFQNAISEFQSFRDYGFSDKLDTWKGLNFDKYDLTHIEKSENLLMNNLSNPANIDTDQKLVMISGRYYEIWQISNVLVGFNAYNIGYWESFLKAGAMGFTFEAEATDPGLSNWVVWEYMDWNLYAAGYDLAKSVHESGGIVSSERLTSAIEEWVSSRYENTQDYVLDSLPVWSLQGASWLYSGIYHLTHQ